MYTVPWETLKKNELHSPGKVVTFKRLKQKTKSVCVEKLLWMKCNYTLIISLVKTIFV